MCRKGCEHELPVTSQPGQTVSVPDTSRRFPMIRSSGFRFGDWCQPAIKHKRSERKHSCDDSCDCESLCQRHFLHSKDKHYHETYKQKSMDRTGNPYGHRYSGEILQRHRDTKKNQCRDSLDRTKQPQAFQKRQIASLHRCCVICRLPLGRRLVSEGRGVDRTDRGSVVRIWDCRSVYIPCMSQRNIADGVRNGCDVFLGVAGALMRPADTVPADTEI